MCRLDRKQEIMLELELFFKGMIAQTPYLKIAKRKVFLSAKEKLTLVRKCRRGQITIL